MIRTGTDISVAECRASGYPVVHHRSKKFDPDARYLVTISDPNGWNQSGTGIKKEARKPYLVHAPG